MASKDECLVVLLLLVLLVLLLLVLVWLVAPNVVGNTPNVKGGGLLMSWGVLSQ
jgi:competence protein ComGC